MNSALSNSSLTKLERVRAELARRSLREFVAQAWPILEPGTTFVDGIHVGAVCDHLQAVTDGIIQNLAMNIPPGHAKSLLTAVFWPAWAWIRRPETRFMFASYSAGLSERDAVKCRTLIESPWYQQRWGHIFQLTDDQNQKRRFANTRTGYRIATSVGGTATGDRGDIVVVDDPTSVDQADSDTERKTANEWWFGTMSTRLNDLATGSKVVIQQRLHEADLTGEILKKGGYVHLMLPAEFEPERKCVTPIWSDPRTTPGELLWPGKVGPEQIADLKKQLGSYRYAGQYQQRPVPAEGGIWKRQWFRFYRRADLPAVWDQVIASWDCSFKGESDSDFVAGQIWARKGADRFLLDQKHARMDFPATLKAIRELHISWPKAQPILIEDKANGPAIISTLRREIPGIVPVDPAGGKIARASAVAAQIEAGNVWLPHPDEAPWIEDTLIEFCTFPAAAHDDRVDSASQGLNRLGRKQFEREILRPR